MEVCPIVGKVIICRGGIKAGTCLSVMDVHNHLWMQSLDRVAIFRELVLVGGGHSHVAVLKNFGMHPIPGIRVTLVSPDPLTPYSGMLPGLMAGHYSVEESHVDLVRLCRFAGADFIREPVTGIDPDKKRVHFAERPDLPFDLCSINSGSTPDTSGISGAIEFSTRVKPVKTFLESWNRMEAEWKSRNHAPTIAVVGGGAGGVELALSLDHRLKTNHQPGGTLHLFQRTGQVLPTHNSTVRKLLESTLHQRGINLLLHAHVTEIKDKEVHYCMDNAGGGDRNQVLHADMIILVTHASPPGWIRKSGMQVDEDGYLALRPDLSSLSHPWIFGAGDSVSVAEFPRPKSGVFAVRQGPPLARNIRRALCGVKPVSFKPQKQFLSLISTGDRYAIASRGPFALHGKWVWHWKDSIDRKWMQQYSKLKPMDTEPAIPHGLEKVAKPEVIDELRAHPMRCGGCGAKVGKQILSRVMENLAARTSVEHPVFTNPDDSSVFSVPLGKQLVQSVDFFPNFYNDPYVFGQIAANHALSDLFAMGATFHSALVNCVIPFQPDERQESRLLQLMSGVVDVLEASGGVLAGGHTSEGSELAVGLTVNGLVDMNASIPKAPLPSNMVLILTKPVGTGIIMAADMKYLGSGRVTQKAIRHMTHSNAGAADILRRHQVKAMTDITGFGLVGHLYEMMTSESVGVELHLDAIPVIEGAMDLAQAGISSSLQPANLRLKRTIENFSEIADHPKLPFLFDPQTSGGLLAAVTSDHSEACLSELREAGYTCAEIMGHSYSGERKIVARQ